MHIHTEQNLLIYFGDASTAVDASDISRYQCKNLIEHASFCDLKKQMPNMHNLFFAHQVHGVDGFHVHNADVAEIVSFSVSADYLVTHDTGIAIGVLTADCLPIIMYDPQHNAVAVVHAGWRGAVAGITQKAIAHMQKEFGSKNTDLKIFFGPCAGVCCYEISNEFLQNVTEFHEQSIVNKNNRLFFNLTQYMFERLMAYGIPAKNICNDYHACTICNHAFCSYRRGAGSALRQMTVALIK